jgi:GMP synthase (glutamine-hydrolysing)
MALLEGLSRVPTLGICFGCQLFAYADGGSLDRFGTARRTADWPVSHPVDRRFTDHPLFTGLPDPCPLGENHCQRVLDPGPNYRVIARSDDGIEAIAHVALPRLGVQFHPEYFPEQAVPHGRRVLENWLALL